jgi:hypothetical protein
MVDILKFADLKQLIGMRGQWCVSIYMPTHQVGREQQQDPIRFKNLTASVQERLIEYGLRRPDVEQLMRPADSLIEDGDFWQHQSDGLAVFLSSDFFVSYRLPGKFEELDVVAKKFHIKPLLPFLSEDRHFYILTVSLNKLRLFLASRDTINEMELPDSIPTSMQDALWMDDPEKHLDFHTGTNTPGTKGNRPAIFHGQGVQSDEDRKNILRYFQYVNDGLSELLNNSSYPMVLAGLDYLQPIYRSANTYAHLLDKGLTVNPDEIDAKALHQRMFEFVKPLFEQDQQQALAQFRRLHGEKSDLAVDDLETAVKAAHFGRVETLFVPLGIRHWGHFDEDGNQVVRAQHPGRKNEDLLDFAAIETILNSGRVYAVQPEDIPGKGDLAAILRYSA